MNDETPTHTEPEATGPVTAADPNAPPSHVGRVVRFFPYDSDNYPAAVYEADGSIYVTIERVNEAGIAHLRLKLPAGDGVPERTLFIKDVPGGTGPGQWSDLSEA